MRDRLKGDLGSKPRNETESRIKNEVVSSFNYSESRENLELAIADAQQRRSAGRPSEIKAMCQMAMNPAMREKPSLAAKPATPTKPAYEDIFTRLTDALEKHPALERLKEPVVELFPAVPEFLRHSRARLEPPGRPALQLMVKNTEAYFESKEEDKDIRANATSCTASKA